eukprot:TRINITY_DN76783_c0_g1_i1.p1 TRINITY_DN76783_c0_g1~~TRINITY_DN76783_c0_g1_i1.p1  ORF type:complete len:474 (-),score=89.72 TRINITY_DN76783_c0_g1_i1:55-1476(-)
MFPPFRRRNTFFPETIPHRQSQDTASRHSAGSLPGSEGDATSPMVFQAMSTNKRRAVARGSINPVNVVGKNLAGTGGFEEKIASCLQAGMAALQTARIESERPPGWCCSSSLSSLPGDRKRVSFEVDGKKTLLEEYAPVLFETVRESFGINEAQHQIVLGGRDGWKDMRYIDVGDAAGKSSAWFLIVGCQRYMLKTCLEKEAKLLLQVLPDYLRHVRERDNSLLPRFYGLYRIEQVDCESVFVVMGNVFAARHPIVARFDIKGSTHNRKASEKECRKGLSATLKDVDLLRRGNPLVLNAGDQALSYLLDAVDADTAWLSRHNLLDYSMMVGLAVRPPNNHETHGRHIVEAVTLLPLSPGEANLMYIGIIDILTKWSCLKWLEALYGRCRRRDCSCKHPAPYAERFRGFIRYVCRSKEAWRPNGVSAEDYERAWVQRTSDDVVAPSSGKTANEQGVELACKGLSEPLAPSSQAV